MIPPGQEPQILGNLPVDGVMSLYSGCSTLLTTVNQPGTRWEEILTTLGPGTYALRFSSVGGVSSSSSQQWLAKRLSGTVALLSAKAVPATGIRYVGDVYNTSSTTRSVTVTARLYSSAGAGMCDVSTSCTLEAWVANYNGENLYTGDPWSCCTSCNFKSPGTHYWVWWQVSSTGSIGGVSGNCDFDAYFSTVSHMAANDLVGS